MSSWRQSTRRGVQAKYVKVVTRSNCSAVRRSLHGSVNGTVRCVGRANWLNRWHLWRVFLGVRGLNLERHTTGVTAIWVYFILFRQMSGVLLTRLPLSAMFRITMHLPSQGSSGFQKFQEPFPNCRRRKGWHETRFILLEWLVNRTVVRRFVLGPCEVITQFLCVRKGRAVITLKILGATVQNSSARSTSDRNLCIFVPPYHSALYNVRCQSCYFPVGSYRLIQHPVLRLPQAVFFAWCKRPAPLLHQVHVSLNLHIKLYHYFLDMIRHICTIFRVNLANCVFKTQSLFRPQMHSIKCHVYTIKCWYKIVKILPV